MRSVRLYQAVQILLPLLLVFGTAVAWRLRTPAETQSDRILRDVTLVGSIELSVNQTSAAVRGLADSWDFAHESELAARRQQVEFVLDVSRQLEKEFQGLRASWIPTAEALELLHHSQELCRQSLEFDNRLTAARRETTARLATPAETPPAVRVKPADPAVDPTALENSAAELASIITSRAQQQIDLSIELRSRTEQAVNDSLRERGTFLGLAASQWLLGMLATACLAASLALVQALRRAHLSLERIERMELESIGSLDRRAAIERCQQRVRGLLDLADSLCRGGHT